MQTLEANLNLMVYSIKHNMGLLLVLLAGLWAIQMVNFLFKQRLCVFGIYPRTIPGFVGIIFSPFLHGSFTHLLFNSIPLFVLANMVMIYGRIEFFYISIFIILVAGFAIWLLARPGFHVGASSLVMGYLGFLLFSAYQQQTFISILVAFICIYYLGGLLLNLFPSEARTSWEGHVFGFIAGVGASYFILSIAPPT